MNKKQLACEAILYLHANPEEFEMGKLRMLANLNNNKGKFIKLDDSERFHYKEVLSKMFGVSTGYIIRMNRLYKTDREAFDYTHKTGKDIPRLRDNGVYLISAGLPNPTKIGRTDCLEMRLSSLQTGCWLSIEVLKWMPIEDARHFEQILHLRFDIQRLNGEWFNLDEEDLKIIETMYRDQLGPKLAQAALEHKLKKAT